VDLEATSGGELIIPSALVGVLPPGFEAAPVNRGSEGGKREVVTLRHLHRWTGTPFVPLDYQSALVDGLLSRAGDRQTVGMVMLPTGGGKTSVGLSLGLRKLSSQSSGIMLWIAPQRELLYQAVEACQRIWWSGIGPHTLDLRVLGAGRDDSGVARHTVVFGTPVSVDRWLRGAARTTQVSQVFFDEAHHLGAQFFRDVWARILTDCPSLQLAIGLSATPMRGQSETFEDMASALENRLFFPRCLLPNPILALQRRGVLANLTVKKIEGIPSYARNACGASNFGVDALSSDPSYWSACIDGVVATSGRAVVYCPNRSTGEIFSRHLCALGERSEFIDGEDALETRLSALERFRDGETRILVNVGLLLEGVDCPAAQTAVVTFPIRSPTRLIQIAGRVSRGPLAGGTPSAEILCADDAVFRFFSEAGVEVDYEAMWRIGEAL
jgi:DNA repair protein RadD